MRRRIVLLVAALLVALLGTTLVLGYSTQRNAPAQAAEPQTRVLVAKALIPAGTPAEQAVQGDLVALTDVPTRLVPPGALVDVVAIRGHESASAIQPGEVLLPSRFVSTTVAGALDIPDDKLAVSVEVADPQRVAGFVRPGLDVAVFDTYDVLEPEQQASGGDALPKVDKATRLLLPRVTVIAVGPTALRTIGTPKTAEGGEDAAGGQAGADDKQQLALVTLAVSVDQAQKLAHASQTGQLTLGLLSKKSRTGTTTADDNRTLFR